MSEEDSAAEDLGKSFWKLVEILKAKKILTEEDDKAILEAQDE